MALHGLRDQEQEGSAVLPMVPPGSDLLQYQLPYSIPYIHT